jgi:uncharacterized membrane protein YbhN (UPF0104 family)
MPASVWLLVLLAFLAGHRLGAAKWRLVVGAAGAALGRVDAIRCYAAGLFANLCLPSIVGGDVLRAALAARATGRAEAAVLGSIADRLIDVFAIAVLVVVGAILARGVLPAWGDALALAVVAASLIVALVLLPLALRRPLARWPHRLRRRVGRSLVALRYLRRAPGAALLAALGALTMQGGFVLLNAWIGHAIGIRVPLGVWFLAWPLAKLAGLLPISLGGLAVRDATLGALLAPAGVPLALGVVASLIWQSVLIAGGLLGGGLWWGLSRQRGVSVRLREPRAATVPPAASRASRASQGNSASPAIRPSVGRG